MNLYNLIRSGVDPQYNCTNFDGFSIGLERPVLGVYFLTAGCIILIIYIPCLFYIYRNPELLAHSSYKIMSYLGIMDISCTITNSISTGYLGLKGATFCSYPTFIFVVGAIGCGCWMGSCSTCILLAINRCCDINPNLKIRAIYIGKAFYITMLIPISYTIYSVFFTRPLLFNSLYMSWFFYPFIPGKKNEEYMNLAHTINNCVVSITTTGLYTYLCIILFLKNRHAQSESLSKAQKQVFLQSVLICSFNAVAAYIYLYMQFFSSPPIIILIGQLAWQFSHGSVCIIYVTMNRTIRKGVFEMIVGQKNSVKIGEILHLNMNNTNKSRSFVNERQI